MKKIFLLLILIHSFIFGAIDECKTDIYFGNGIMTTPEQAEDATLNILYPSIKALYHNEKEMKQHIGKIAYAYNSTHLGGLHDLIESLYQKLSLTDYLDKLAELWNKMQETAHQADLNEQMEQYQNSINDGHKVLVIAHSQGNLFAYEIFHKLPEWMHSYWEAIGIASPGMLEIKEGAPSIAWDNDLVADLALNPLRSRIACNVRRVSWKAVSGGSDTKPNEIYLYKKNVGKKYGSFRSEEGILEQFDFNVHSFSFYMGNNLTGLISGKKYKDIFEDTYLQDNGAKIIIMNAIKNQLNKLESIPSQWSTDQELDRGTCDYRITVKHRFDPSLEIGEKVYPFAPNQKLYQVNGEYVKATCGGKNILTTWEDKKENECLMIDNPPKEIISANQCAFEVAVNNNNYTCYDKDTFFTYVHTTNYSNYTFYVHYDDINTSWTACRHCTQKWANSHGDILEIGNGAGGHWIHQAINFYVHISQ